MSVLIWLATTVGNWASGTKTANNRMPLATRSYSAHCRSISVACRWLCALLALGASSALSAPVITLGQSDGLALDQPRVTVEVINPNTSSSLGPDFSNQLLLDTAATSVLIVGQAVNELEDHNYQTEENQYLEQGIGGFEPYYVSIPYRVDFAGTSGIRNTLPGTTRIMSNVDKNFGSFSGIMGMPAMIERTVSLDMTVFSGGGFDFIGVEFDDQAIAPAPNRYQFPLRLQDFPQHGQIEEGDPLPTAAPLPYVPVMARNYRASDGQPVRLDTEFILDSGAQLSIISRTTAELLGIDVEAETLYTLPVGGIGEEVEMPVVPLDNLALSFTKGPQVMWTGLEVGVLDIDPGIPGEPTIAGIFGMELLTSGWFDAIFGGPDGYLSGVHYDFLNSELDKGMLSVDIRPDLNSVVYEGDADGNGTVNILDVAYISEHWLQIGPEGDANLDGVVNIFDVGTVTEDWMKTNGSGATSVPEPASSVLALFAATLLLPFVLGSLARRRSARR